MQTTLSTFHEGKSYRAYQFMGSHFCTQGLTKGVVFRVYAPRAISVSVVGDFNQWNMESNKMQLVSNGVWECFIVNLKNYDNYKYAVSTDKGVFFKTDPYGYHFETAPATATKVYELEGYKWRDGDFLERRSASTSYDKPVNIYEVNLLSWRMNDNGTYYSYRQLAETLVPYVKEMGYTHVEFMPVTEYPFDGSWGYQVTGYFGITSRQGTPMDFMHLVDEFHLNGIAVILDWVPAHFTKDAHGLFEFDGYPLYEDANPLRMEHKGWGTRVFDYGRAEVQSFLISSAMFYFDKYHIDGLRVDAVASMLYLDYGREDGEWQPNEEGGNINLQAVDFLKKLNSAVFENYPFALMIAEESTAFPMVTMPVYIGGLGFNYKWNMGWMNDSLDYCKTDALYRKGVHNKLTFSLMYAFTENFILPISHDEVVHGKCSLLNKMPGEYADKFANAKTFLGYMMAHPGKKLTFMGNEFGQFKEWAYKEGLEFFMLDYPTHRGLHNFYKDINDVYRTHDALYSIERDWSGFEWLVSEDCDHNTYVFKRTGASGQQILVFLNFSGADHKGYVLGVGEKCTYKTLLCSDDERYGGCGTVKHCTYKTRKGNANGKDNVISITVPKYSVLYLIRQEQVQTEDNDKKSEAKVVVRKTAKPTEIKEKVIKTKINNIIK